MLRPRFKIRCFAIILLTIQVTSLLLPLQAYALTGGPASAEFSSYEPFDTTTMVNPATGDFTYNIPLLNVPSPEGGFPVSIAYHSGTTVEEQASWVGLGWTLNVGAINRNLDGYPDDFRGLPFTDNLYWPGGVTVTETQSFGINWPFVIVCGINYASMVATDTYEGTAYSHTFGSYIGYGFNFSGGSGVNAGAGGGEGGAGGSADLMVGIGSATTVGRNFDGSLILDQTSYVFASAFVVSAYAGFTYGTSGFNAFGGGSVGIPLVWSAQASISSGKSWSGSSGWNKVYDHKIEQKNSKEGIVSTYTRAESSSLNLVLFNYSESTSYTYYWIDQTDELNAYGSLYPQYASAVPGQPGESSSMDTYALPETDNGYAFSIANNSDPNRGLGGSFPAYDLYAVAAPSSIGGSMQPYVFEEGAFYRQKMRESGQSGAGKTMRSYLTNGKLFTKPVSFRYKNEFSNTLQKELTGNTPFTFTANTNASSISSNSISTTLPSADKYNSTNQMLAGSKHIEWFTHKDVVDGIAKSKGFMRAPNYNYSDYTNDKIYQIAGFSITATDGLTYHFTIPVYTINVTKSVSNHHKYGNFTRTRTSPAYAYTWLMTGITGPDYVDRNDNGLIDDEDWGYWVDFSYGKWADDYLWRTPGQGSIKDKDNRSYAYNFGKKQIYYLDAIRTRTHTALFLKDTRHDAKSVTDKDVGGYNPIATYQACTPERGSGFCLQSETIPTSVLRLSKIVLVSNQLLDDAIRLKKGSLPQFSYEKVSYLKTVDADPSVITIRDYNQFGPTLEAQSMKQVVFTHDYSLVPSTPNSFDITNFNPPDVKSDLDLDDVLLEKLGKLSLKAIDILGFGATKIVPPTVFSYEPDDLWQGSFAPGAPIVARDQSPSVIEQSQSQIPLQVQPPVGAILKTNIIGKPAYCLYLGDNRVRWITRQPSIAAGQVLDFVQTFNPPYHKEYYDVWGNYKPDYVDFGNEAVSRQVTPISKESVTAWSLRKIRTPLGMEMNIQMESDDYANVALRYASSMPIKNFDVEIGNEFVNINLDSTGIDVNKLLTIGNNIKLTILAEETRVNRSCENRDMSSTSDYRVATIDDLEIVAISSGSLRARSSGQLANFIQRYIPDGMCNRTIVSMTPIHSNLSWDFVNQTFGGGVRVRAIKYKDLGSFQTTSTEYTYTNTTGTVSSGATTYEPTYLGWTKLNPNDPHLPDYAKRAFLTQVYQGFSPIMTLAREIPGPGVLYEHVRIVSQGTDGTLLPGRTEYQFLPFRDWMFSIAYSAKYQPTVSFLAYENASGNRLDPSEGTVSSESFEARDVTLRDFTSAYGSLVKMTQYDGAGQVVSEIRNDYIHDLVQGSKTAALIEDQVKTKYGGQGLIHQAFVEIRRNDVNNNTARVYQAVRSRRVEIPNFVVASHAKQNGISSTTRYLKFDWLTGSPTVSEQLLDNGYKLVTVVKPAYTVTSSANDLAYPNMGPKLNQASNRNMLTQPAETYTLLLEDGQQYDPAVPITTYPILNASITTWKNTWTYRVPAAGVVTSVTPANMNTPRKHKEFVWRSYLDDLGAYSRFVPYNWANAATQDAGWQLQSETTLYSPYSQLLEVSDINGDKAASKYGYGSTRLLASLPGVAYTHFATTGFEDYSDAEGMFGGEVPKGSIVVCPASEMQPHTGNYSAKLTNSTTNLFTAVVAANQRYKASVWVKAATPAGVSLVAVLPNNQTVSATTTSPSTVRAGDWYLLNLDIPLPTAGGAYNLTVQIKNTSTTAAYFDDFKTSPIETSFKTFVYDANRGLVTAVLDELNLGQKFEYDAMDRVVKTYTEYLDKPGYTGGFKLTSEQMYNNALMPR